MEQFKVVFTGALKPGVDQETFVTTFSSRFKISKEKALHMLSAGKPVTIKKDLNAEQAAKYIQALEAMGMVVRQEPMISQTLSLEPIEEKKEASADSTAPSVDKCPKCGSDRIEGDNCLGCGIVISKYQQWAQEHPDQAATPTPVGASNPEHPVSDTSTPPEEAKSAPSGEQNPYQAPEAKLTQEAERGEMTGPISVPAGHGWTWLKDGFGHFRQNPGSWILAIIAFIGIMGALSKMPYIGSLLTSLISPIFGAGFVIGCRTQDEGEDFSFNHLFEGFKENTGQLLLVGLIYMAGTLAIGVLVVFAIIGASGLGFMFGADPDAMAASPDFFINFMLAMLVMMLLLIPLIMAYWFAPALVALDGLSAVKAMKLSFTACLKNILPFLLYGIIAFVLLFLGILPFGLGLLVVGPMLTASIYTSYRDIFYS